MLAPPRPPIPVLLLVLCANSPATTSYVSPSGNNANAGTSTAAPWKTVVKVNASSFDSGDRAPFETGQTFADGTYPGTDDGGTAANPVVIGSYGNGRATISPATDENGVEI